MTEAKDWITAQPPADTPQTHGDVERVARAIYTARIAGGKNYCDFDDLCTNGHNDTYEKVMADAAAALAAMRPVSVDEEKLAEIRARHEHLDGQLSKRTTGITPYEGVTAHADRAYLLSLIGGSHDED